MAIGIPVGGSHIRGHHGPGREHGHPAARGQRSPHERVARDARVHGGLEQGVGRRNRAIRCGAGRRIRKAGSGSDILITSGYLRFSSAVERVLTDLITGKPLAERVSPAALTSALIGMFESMLRDQVMARRVDFHFSSTSEEIRVVFELFVSRLLASPPENPQKS